MGLDFHGFSPFMNCDTWPFSFRARSLVPGNLTRREWLRIESRFYICFDFHFHPPDAVTRSNTEAKPSVRIRVLPLYPKSFIKLELTGSAGHRVRRNSLRQVYPFRLGISFQIRLIRQRQGEFGHLATGRRPAATGTALPSQFSLDFWLSFDGCFLLSG
jgi:hypothetical protein